MSLVRYYQASLEEYLNTYKLTRSPSTVYKVKCILGRFLRDCEDLELGALIEWQEDQAKRISSLVGAQHCGIVSAFLDWLVEMGRLLVNPLPQEWRIPNSYPKVRTVPSQQELEEVELRQVSMGAMFPHRNRALLELAYSLGLRRAELRSLNLGDIQGDTLRVIGKGNKERLLPLPNSSKKKIQVYLKSERGPMMEDQSEKALFVSLQKKRVSLTSLNAIFKEQMKLSFTPHQLRHACASHMLQNGCSLRVLQKYLGHESLESTQVYTRVDLGDLREMLGKCHMRA